MPKIILSDDEGKEQKEIELKESEPIKEACKELGVPFSCEDGICGTCMIDILEGEENLSELTQQERDLMGDKKHRLACQCGIKSDVVKIRF